MSVHAVPYAEPEPQPLRRHSNLDLICSRLERILYGRAAKALLEDVAALPARAGIVLLPAWTWVESKINVGRKDSDPENRDAKLLMPVRNVWTAGGAEAVLMLTDGETADISYRSVGMGHRLAGQGKIVHVQSGRLLTVPEKFPSLAEPVFAGSGPKTSLLRELRKLVEEGEAARWEMLKDIEPHVLQTLRVAHASVCHEIGQSTGVVQTLLDETAQQQVLDLMMYGEVDEKGEERVGSVFRLIELCLQPKAFTKVDPLRMMTKHLRRDAEAEIRKKLGDPHIGPKIREIARQHDYRASDIVSIVDAYRKKYPRDHLAVERAEAALSVRPDAMANRVEIGGDVARLHESGPAKVLPR